MLWLDEQFSPVLAPWIEAVFSVSCCSVVDLPVNRASDLDIFMAARMAEATIVSKDSDFVELILRHGPPPQLVWVTAGNRSNKEMKTLFAARLGEALRLLEAGEPVVEIAQ